LGHSVRVLDNDWRGAQQKLSDVKRDIQFVQADIREESKVQKACRGIDAVCHLAYINGTRYFYTMPEVVLEVGVLGMINVIKGALRHHVPELITASSSEVYQNPPRIPTDESAPLVVPDPLNPRFSYGGGKILSELLTFNYGRKYFKRAVVFRPHNVFGPDMGWEHVIPQFALRMKYLSNKNSDLVRFPLQGQGRETRAFIFIDDFTEGLVKVILKGKHMNLYHIGTNEERSIREVAAAVASFYGKKIKIIPQKIRQGSTPRRCPDISKLKKLGFNPSIGFKKALMVTVDWYDQHAAEIPAHLKREVLHGI
jgi:nucleoside-diphosphate-sugar epimerase